MQDTHLSSVLWFLVMKFKMARVRTQLLHGGFKVGEVRQWYVRTTKFGLMLDRTNGCLAVQVLDRCTWNEFAFACALKGVRRTEAVGSQCTSQQFFKE